MHEEGTKYKELMDELVRQLVKSSDDHPIGAGQEGVSRKTVGG